MDELLAKDSLTLVEKDELTKLQRSNDELERRAKILDIQQKAQAEEVAATAKEALGKRRHLANILGFQDYSVPTLNEDGTVYKTRDGQPVMKTGNVMEAVTSWAKNAQGLQDSIDNYTERLTNPNLSKGQRKNLENQIELWQKEYDGYVEDINEKLSDTDLFNENIDLIKDPAIVRQLNTMYDAVDELFGTSGSSTTAKIEGAVAKYKDLRDNLIDLANAGQLTGKNLKSAGGDFSAFYDDMVRKGVSIDDVISHFQSIADPSGYNFDTLRKQFKETLKGAGKDAQDFVDGLSEEELTAYAQIKAEDIDTSEWDTGVWKEQIKERLESETIEVDINATPRLDKFREAVKKESEAEEKGNSDNYKFIQSNLEDIIKMRKDGLIGTDIFRSFTSFISPNGIDTLKEYDKAIGKIKRYFTEDNTGIGNFVTDLKSLGMLTQSGNQLSLQIDDVGQAAKDMGVSVETFVAVCQRLNDYGIFTGIYNNAEEAKEEIQGFYDEYSKLEAERDALTYAINDKKNPLSADDKSAALDKVNALNGKINELKGNIDAAMDSYLSLLSGGDSGDTIEDIANNAEAAIGSAQRMAFKTVEEFNNLDWSKYKNASQIQETIKENLAQLGKEAGGEFTLNGGKLTFEIDKEAAQNKGVEAAQEAQKGADTNPVRLSTETQISSTDNVESELENLANLWAESDDIVTRGGITQSLDEVISKLKEMNLTSEDINDILAETNKELENVSLVYDNGEISIVPKVDFSEVEASEAELTLLTQKLAELGVGTSISVTVDSGQAYATIDGIKYQVDTLPDGQIRLTALDGISPTLVPIEGKLQVVNQGANAHITVDAGNALSTLSSIVSLLNRVVGKNVVVTVTRNIISRLTGGDELYGNAKQNGNARAGGNWGEVRDVTALAGEIGSELVVRGNNWFTIDYPQFFKFKKGDIIFNADQTKAILEGRHTSFGRSLAQGNTGEARAAASGYGENPVLAGLITNPKAAKATEKAAKAVEKASKSASKDSKSKVQTNNNVYNWWQAYLDGASKTLNNFKSELDKLNSQYEDAIAHGWDESAKFIEERLKKSKEKYDKNFMDTLNELKADEQENLNALVNIRPEFKGKSALDIINDETLEMQITKGYEDKLAATTDDKTKEKIQKEFDTFKSYLSSLESIRNEISSMEGNIRYVSDEYKLKVIGNAIKLFNNGDASQVEEWAAKYGYESAEAFVDAWNRQDPDLMGWFKKAEVLDDGVLERRIAALQHTVDGNDFSLDVLADDSSNNGKRIELLKQQQALYHEMANEYRAFNYDEDSDEIQDLQSKWRDSAKEIYEIEKDIAETRREGIQSRIDDYDWFIDQAGEESEEARHKYTLRALGDEVNLYDDIASRIAECNRELKNGAINVDEIKEELADLREQQKDAISKIIEYMHALYDVEYEKIDDKIEDIKDDNDAIVDSLEEQIDALEKEKDKLEDISDKYKQAAEAVKKCLDNEKKMLEQEKEQKENYWDARLEALEKANDEQTKAYDLTKKQQALEEAQSQKNTAIYRDGKIVYESNFNDVRQASQDLAEEKRQQQYEKRKALLEDERDAEIQAIEDRMKSLDNYEDLWSEVFDKYTDEINEQSASELISADWQKRVLAMRKDTWEDFRDAYYNVESRIEGYLESEIEKLNDSKDAAQESCDKQVEALEKSKKALEEQEKTVDDFAAKFAEAFITGDNSALNSFLKFVEGIAVGSTEVSNNIQSIISSIKDMSDNISEDKPIEDTSSSKAKSKSAVKQAASKKFGSAFASKLLGYASGTSNAPRGLSLVGERGAELINFQGGEQVLNAQDTSKLLGAVGSISNGDILDIVKNVPSLSKLMGSMGIGEAKSNISNDSSVHMGDINVAYDGESLDKFMDLVIKQLPFKMQQIISRK